jgi:hypothetical protein
MHNEDIDLNDEIVESNKDIVDSIEIVLSENIKTYSRDWTVDTIYSQIIQGNIELNPKFQRRNAWNDDKRSRLIESLILKFPVPEIVLAESHTEKNKFVVLDGKQRLLTIAGFFDHEQYKYWDNPVLRGLKLKPELIGKDIVGLSDENNSEDHRALLNSDIRCTVVFNQTSDDILYEIFYRLNSGAVPLSMQELRQSLRKGGFSDFLLECTENPGALHRVLGIDQPDKRLIDAEIVLKFIANRLRLDEYAGNLKKFLDDTMILLNREWKMYDPMIEGLFSEFEQGITTLEYVVGLSQIGRYFNEQRFNRNIFDVQIYYFSQLFERDIKQEDIDNFKQEYKEICRSGSAFRQTLTSSTNTSKNVAKRFDEFRKVVNSSFGTDFEQILPVL